MAHHTSILVVDDDVSGRAMLGLSLKQFGFDVRTAADGEEAINILSGKHFDWMITDGKMYPIDGFELAKQANRIQPDLRIVMTSAIYTEQDINCRHIEKFFPKPVVFEDLLSWISA